MKLLALQDVCLSLGIKKTKLYGEITKGTFTKPVKIGSCSRWPESEVNTIVAAHIGGANDFELTQLVCELMRRRKA